MSQYKIEAGSGQHVGDRDEQQDRVGLFASARAPGYMMAIVADGMGGRTGGAMAAEQVIHTAKQQFDTFSPLIEDVETLLRNIAQETHTVIQLTGATAENEPHSTMVVLVITPDGRAVWAHIGDSRLYRFEGAVCAERTTDHSLVEQLIDEGKITRAEARNHRLSNVLVKVLGSSRSQPEVTIGSYEGLHAGCSFLLCTDGLWPYFNREELGKAISYYPPRRAAEVLIQKAGQRAKGKGDNCTLAIVKLVAPPDTKKSRLAANTLSAV